MINYTFDGRLTRDAVTKTTTAGRSFTNFAVACDIWDSVAKKRDTHFYECNYFGERGAKLLPYLKKGKPVVISGEPSWSLYNEKVYEKISVRDISLISSFNQNEDSPDGYPVAKRESGPYTDAQGNTYASEEAFNDALADEVWGRKPATQQTFDDADIPF
jgi:single-strand DNA-binding protein